MLSDKAILKRFSRRKFLSGAVGTAGIPRAGGNLLFPHDAPAWSAASHRFDSPGSGRAASQVTAIRVDATPGQATNSFSPHRALFPLFAASFNLALLGGTVAPYALVCGQGPR